MRHTRCRVRGWEYVNVVCTTNDVGQLCSPNVTLCVNPGQQVTLAAGNTHHLLDPGFALMVNMPPTPRAICSPHAHTHMMRHPPVCRFLAACGASLSVHGCVVSGGRGGGFCARGAGSQVGGGVG